MLSKRVGKVCDRVTVFSLLTAIVISIVSPNFLLAVLANRHLLTD